jgi:hypothetical protein
MKRSSLRSITMLATALLSPLPAAATPPDPTAAADLFVPAVPGLAAADVCVASKAISGRGWVCDFGNVPGTTIPQQLGLLGDASMNVDAAGNLYLDMIEKGQILSAPLCVDTYGTYTHTVRRRLPSGNIEAVGAFSDQCLPDQYIRRITVTRSHVDPINGVLLVEALLRNDGVGGQFSNQVRMLVKVAGLPNIFDVALTYQPPSTLSFNVPVRPEGLPGADSFAVYAGDVRTASDLSQASPLQCTVPAGRLPVPGEQLTIADALPDPSPGNGRYYVAAVRHGGQIRAGRSIIGGVLQGRNAAPLPGCQ